jgi:hypothetical protein
MLTALAFNIWEQTGPILCVSAHKFAHLASGRTKLLPIPGEKPASIPANSAKEQGIFI